MISLTDNGGNVSPVMIGCKFQGNTARTASGSALTIIAHDAFTAPQLINTIVTGNHVSEAIHAFVTGSGTAEVRIVNSTLAGNAAGSIRVVDLGTPSSLIFVRNSILWNNPSNGGLTSNGATEDVAFSAIPFGFPGEGNVGLDPLFVDAPLPVNTPHVLGDVHLGVGSPAIDAGSNSDVPAGITTDAEGSARFINSSNGQVGIVDMGAYEVQGSTTGIDDFLADTDWKVFPNPVAENIIVTWSKPSIYTELHVIDANGKLVSSSQMNKGEASIELNVSSLPAGSYFIHLMIDGGQDVKKVVVQ